MTTNVASRRLHGSMGLLAGCQKRIVETLWQQFFSDPSQWWDHRTEKVNSRYPDFKHKKTEGALWLDGKFNPPWVKAELAALAPGRIQSNIFSWNKNLARYTKDGQYEKTMQLFQQMQREGIAPDRFTFVPLLNACANLRSLEVGRRIHTQIVHSGFESNVYVGSSLVDMYTKCGSIVDARSVFLKMPTRNVVSWNTIILGHVKCRQGQEALELFTQMQQEGVDPSPGTFVAVLNACASLGALREGKGLHDQIIRSGHESNVFVGNSLIDMYGKCGSIVDARSVFNKMPKRNVVSWNSMILAHVKCGEEHQGLELSQRMQQEGLDPDSVSFIGMINACASLAALEEGKRVHNQVIESGYDSDVFVANSLVDMYAKCGSIEDAMKVFSAMPRRNVVAWTAMIHGYVKCRQGQKSLDLFGKMLQQGVEPVPATFVGVLNGCASIAALGEGKLIHEQVIQGGCESNRFVVSSLVDMYAKCGSLEDAWSVFCKMPKQDIVAWNAIILGHAKCGQGQKAFELFRQMRQDGVQPGPVTFVGLLNACASIAALEEGSHIHEHIIESGCESDIFVSSSLVDMYSKCGNLEAAHLVFNKMCQRDVVTWNTMLGGYAMHGHATEALGHFERMCQEGIEADGATFVSLLTACSHGGLVDEGFCYFNSMISLYGISATLEHYSCMADLLGRAGYLHEAEDLIKTMSCEPDITMWISLLGACKVHCNVQMAEYIARQVLELDVGNVSKHLLLSNIYAAARSGIAV